ncbi:MAG: hypothetical protein WC003_00630 [Terrimicrobiaceae bacterium]
MIFSGTKPVATVALNMRWRRGPYGGGNQWVGQVQPSLERCGYRTVSKLDNRVDCVLGTHVGLGGELSISFEEVLKAKESNPRLRCIQRINDNDIRKGTDKMDAFLARCNRAADHTVFVSEWLRDYHAERWFDVSRPHSVIHNGADPAVFHPVGSARWVPGTPFRLVTHHWSDNMAKGFDVYAGIDSLIAEGRLPGVELWVIGRWPGSLAWRAARTWPACSGHSLARLLRQCHAAVTASRHEPGAMHPVESLQCGLPLLYHPDTGGTVELGRRFGVMISGGLREAVLSLMDQYEGLRARVIEGAPDGDLMCRAYRRIIEHLLTA